MLANFNRTAPLGFQADKLKRRALLKKGLALPFLGSLGHPAWAGSTLDNGPRVYRPDSLSTAQENPQEATPNGIKLGRIEDNFWSRPRELWLYRQETKESVKVVYWKDGQLNAEGYWQICALMRDVRENIMTTMDPALLDVLRGMLGYYEQWKWPYPLVILSGFRTLKTNNSLMKEGAARNSMHLYGRAADLYMPGVPLKDIAALGVHFQRGGVGFYPDNGFVHLDTGNIRTWARAGNKR
jgi:uncharacterized protein YcbK (DUF882 family)